MANQDPKIIVNKHLNIARKVLFVKSFTDKSRKFAARCRLPPSADSFHRQRHRIFPADGKKRTAGNDR
jgi:hypothetical protein